MASTHKRCSTLLFISKKQIKTIKMSTNKNVGRLWRKGNSPMLLVGMCVGAATMEGNMEITQKTKNTVAIQSVNPTPGHIARRIDNSERCMNPNAQSSTIHNSQDMETT